MSNLNKNGVKSGDVGVVIGKKYKPFRGIVDFSKSDQYYLPNKQKLIKATEYGEGLLLLDFNSGNLYKKNTIQPAAL